ncbi:helix-turn-helix transcriptional regulator [Deinococcus sp.]|uniref:helix-turn-helix domain-containing protein n=1 Tax=Deinococcus sp. TaxID=47478 RepID=UPI0025F7207F|nr:helix-turn-helix transcriptional regulator [Deinococcus sp.]
MNVNDEIRQTVKDAMHSRKLNQVQLAEKLGVTPQALSRTLNERGKVPGLWRGILEELGLVLTVKAAEGEHPVDTGREG